MWQRLKHLFIPHEGNNFKPNFLERTSMGAMLVLVLLSFAIANIQSLVWVSSDWMVSSILPSVIVKLTNNERGTESITALRRSSTLDAAAQLKADDMVTHGYFAHYSPDGLSPWHWFDAVSYTYVHAGENLAVHFTDSDEVVAAWMQSPGHRANIMNGEYTEIGIGTAKGTYKGVPTVFVVQLFGTPGIPKPTASLPPVAVVTETVPLATAQGIAEEVITTASPARTLVTTSTVAAVSTTSETQNRALEDMSDENVVATYPSTMMFTDLATTSNTAVTAALTTTNTQKIAGSSEVSVLGRVAIQPKAWLSVIYIVLALVVVLALILSVAIEWRKQHPVQVAYASGMLAVMAFLFYVHVTLIGGVIIV